MNPDTDIKYQTVNLFSSDKCFNLLLSWCSTLHSMKSAHHCLYNSGIKVDILDTCGEQWYVHTLELHFCYFFIKIENAAYTSCQNSALLFINGFISDIMNTENNQSLVFEWKPVLAPLRSVMIEGFHGFLSYSKIGWILSRNAKETLKEMLACSKCSYRGAANI